MLLLSEGKKSEGSHRKPPEISINPKSQLLIFFPLEDQRTNMVEFFYLEHEKFQEIEKKIEKLIKVKEIGVNGRFHRINYFISGIVFITLSATFSHSKCSN
jgi:hypothetical protein